MKPEDKTRYHTNRIEELYQIINWHKEQLKKHLNRIRNEKTRDKEPNNIRDYNDSAIRMRSNS